MAKTLGDLDDREEIDWLEWILVWAINVTGIVAASLFAFLNFEKSDVIRVVVSTPPEGIVKVTLLIYYICWHYGAIIDVRLHKKVLLKEPNKGRIGLSKIGTFLIFILTAYGLLWASSYEIIFAISILIFWSVLTVAGEITRRHALPMFYESGRWYAANQRPYEVEKLVRVSRYFWGSQMRLRNAAGFILTLLVVLVTFAEPLRESIALMAQRRIPAAQTASIAALVPALTFVAFVLVTEAWQWIMRIRVLASIKVLDELKKTYYLERHFQNDGPSEE